MSIIRDFIEYYRLPEEVKDNIGDFISSQTLLNGSQLRYYYMNPRRMIIDMFTSNGTRYYRTTSYYDTILRVTSIVHEYDYGRKQRIDTFSYGDISVNSIISIVTVESDISIAWVDPPPSEGWDIYDPVSVREIDNGNGILVDASNPYIPVISTRFATNQDMYENTPNVSSSPEIISQVYIKRVNFDEIMGKYNLTVSKRFSYDHGKYGSPTVTPTNILMQKFVVPLDLSENDVIKAYLWGGGGTNGTGGYTYGEFVVKPTGVFNESNPSHVYPGMILCVQVGYIHGRAAIWRNDTPYFNSYLNELLVAGGGSGGSGGGLIGGDGSTVSSVYGSAGSGAGATNSGPGGGGTGTSNGSSACNTNGSAGQRVWGAPSYVGCRSVTVPAGGDGYYGGGTGGSYYGAPSVNEIGIGGFGTGGGGSSYIRPGIVNTITETNVLNLVYPPMAHLPLWSMSGGMVNVPALVVFEIDQN